MLFRSTGAAVPQSPLLSGSNGYISGYRRKPLHALHKRGLDLLVAPNGRWRLRRLTQ
jgi:hypothetical protein